MTPQQIERLIKALESIAASLNNLDADGIEVFCGELLTVNAMISAPEGIEITEMPDKHFVQVLNPINHTTGQQKPFEIETAS